MHLAKCHHKTCSTSLGRIISFYLNILKRNVMFLIWARIGQKSINLSKTDLFVCNFTLFILAFSVLITLHSEENCCEQRA